MFKLGSSPLTRKEILGSGEQSGTPLDLKNTPLPRLAEKLWHMQGFSIEENYEKRGINGDSYKFDYVLRKHSKSKSTEEIGVLVRDWKRSVGVDVLIKIDQIAETTGMKQIMVLGNMFSANARTFAKSRGIILLVRSDLISMLGYR